jgi:hypothetical protein
MVPCGLVSRGITAVEDTWHGYDVRPLDEDRLLLEALRDLIGAVGDPDDGQRIGGRLVDWLSRHAIDHDYQEQVGEAY